jgi:hypothetical protein
MRSGKASVRDQVETLVELRGDGCFVAGSSSHRHFPPIRATHEVRAIGLGSLPQSMQLSKTANPSSALTDLISAQVARTAEQQKQQQDDADTVFMQIALQEATKVVP